MDPVIRLEVVDRDNRVVHEMPLDAAAFPLTIRLAGSAEQSAELPVATYTNPAARVAAICHGRTWIAAAAAFAVFAVVTWSQALARSPTPGIIGGALGYLSAVALYAAAWAVGGRMATRSAKYGRHFVWACTCAVAAIVFGAFSGIVLFMLPSPAVFAIITCVWIAFATVAIFGHLGIASSMPSWRRWRVAGFAVGTMVALAALASYASRNDFSTRIENIGPLEPLSARVVPAQSVDDFAHDLDAIKKDVDKAAAKKP